MNIQTAYAILFTIVDIWQEEHVESPLGVIYAGIMDRMTLEEFNTIITNYTDSGLITVSNYLAKPTPYLLEKLKHHHAS